MWKKSRSDNYIERKSRNSLFLGSLSHSFENNEFMDEDVENMDVTHFL